MNKQEAIAEFERRIEMSEKALSNHVSHDVIKFTKKIDAGIARQIELYKVAIEALRASEPRVLQKDELYAIKEPTPVWVEHKTHTAMNSWRIWGFIANPGWPGEWRCWSKRPTAEQMQATPWKESETE